MKTTFEMALEEAGLDRNWLLLICDRLEELERNRLSSETQVLLQVKNIQFTQCLADNILSLALFSAMFEVALPFLLFRDLRANAISIPLIYNLNDIHPFTD